MLPKTHFHEMNIQLVEKGSYSRGHCASGGWCGARAGSARVARIPDVEGPEGRI